MPVIASNVGGISESVREGVNGYLINPLDDSQWAAKIRYLIEKPQKIKKFGEASRAIYEKEFKFERMVISTENIYKEIWHIYSIQLIDQEIFTYDLIVI